MSEPKVVDVPEFVSVPRELRDSIVTIHRNRYSDRINPLIQALMTGETLFVKTESKKLNGLYEQARRRKFSMTLRQGFDENNNAGCYLWWEPITEGTN